MAVLAVDLSEAMGKERDDGDTPAVDPAHGETRENRKPDGAKPAVDAQAVYRADFAADRLTPAAEAEAEEAELAATQHPLSHDDHLRELRDALALAHSQLGETQEQERRARAEIVNQARRFENAAAEQRRSGLRRFLVRLLKVMDDLERGLDAAAGAQNLAALTEGMALTRKNFQDALSGAGVEAVDPVGEAFDPALHEAIATVEQPASAPHTVVQVAQKGYTMDGTLLRAARVVVSAAPPATS